MITCITGKPGDGKSLFAARELLEVLIKTDKFVVTNLPLRLGNLQEFVSKRIKGPFDIDSRVKVIDDAEVYEFYRHRSGDLVLPWSPDKEAGEIAAKRLPRPEFIEKMKETFSMIRENEAYQKPCVYIIDEAHNFFSSRDWATNGRGLLYYASQHRHLHDEIYLITQVLDNVDKQLRGLISETHQVRNQLRRRIGPVRMRPVFRLKSYYGVPSGLTAKPFAETTFDLDLVGVANCYNTVGALGVHKNAEEKKNKGILPWWTLPIGGIAVVVAIIGAFVGLPMMGGRLAAKSVSAISPQVSIREGERAEEKPQLIQYAVQSQGFRHEREPKRYEREGVPEIPVDEIYVKGWLQKGPRISVILSNGETVTEELEEVERINRNAVKVRGKWIPIRRTEGAGVKPQKGEAVADRIRASDSANEKQSGAISS